MAKPLSEDWGDIDSFCNKYGFYFEQQQQQQQKKTHFKELPDECVEPSIFQNTPTTVEIVRRAVDGSGDLERAGKSRKLSTNEILKLAGERFVHFSSQKLITSMDSYDSSLSTLSLSDKQDVDLAQLLLAAAEMVGNRQLDRATTLLSHCQWISSNVGTPVQRAVFYFAEALTDRINKEKSSSNDRQETESGGGDACSSMNVLALLAMHQELPIFQIVHFTTAQTIFENVGNNPKIHLIDFQILTGLHWASFIQAMSEQARNNDDAYLRITAVEIVGKSEAEKAGKLLQSFADHLNLPFSYNLIYCSDIKDLRQEDFAIDPQETVAVLFGFVLRTLISKPFSLKNLMTITKEISPSITVVCEVEANHNSPTFVSRFIEALFYYGAMLDGLAESMAGDSRNREEIESGTFREGIRNIVATEGYERITRSVPIGVWRAFFARFGMREVELSSAAVYQARLIVNQSDCGRCCSLDESSKCLLVGWKGTPLFSVSAWKF